MAERELSHEEMRLLKLYRQFVGLTEDADTAGRVIFLGPDGTVVAVAALSARDIEGATDALTAYNDAKAAMKQSEAPAEPLPAVAEQDVTAGLTELENFANGGQL